ncbi:MAG: hypothetical protein ACK2UL_07195, partial [Anaerolineae bacterium]
LNHPSGVAGDGDAVWIADTLGRRALKFASAGGFMDEIGRAGLWHGIHEYPVRSVSDVAVSYALPPGADPGDPDVQLIETVWLVDTVAHYVVGLTRATGETMVIGEPDVPGADDAHLDSPQGVALDAAGNLYVSDTFNHRVQVFGADGSLRATIGTPGSSGNADDQLAFPMRLTVGYHGRLYVADAGNNRVQAFDITNPAMPTYAQTYGTGQEGSGPLELSAPSGVATDATFVYVADSGNCRVQVLYRTRDQLFDSIGSPGGCTGDDPIRFPTDVALDDAGHVYIADPGTMRVHQRKPEDRSAIHEFGTLGVPYVTDNDHYNEPSGVASTSDGATYIVERAGHRLIRRDADGSVPWVVGTPGMSGGDDEHLAAPQDVAVDGADRAYVSGSVPIRVFAADGTPAGTIGARGRGPGELVSPRGLGLASDGRVGVADADRHVVQVFDSSGNHVATVGREDDPGADDSRLNTPYDAAFDARGYLYVADAGNHRVQVFDAGYSYVGTIGQTGAPGADFASLRAPRYVAADAANRVYVSDTGNDRVEVFGPDLAYLTTIGGRAGQRSGELREPFGLHVDAAGRMYVADSGNHRVQLYDPPRGPFTAASVNGFASPLTEAVASMADFDGALLAGTHDPSGGASIWRRDRATGDWSMAAGGGLGDADNIAIGELEAFGGNVYAGVENVHETVDPVTGRVTSRSSTGGA